jgi:hypothetical protein
MDSIHSIKDIRRWTEDSPVRPMLPTFDPYAWGQDVMRVQNVHN